jgi:hypothetical protein
VFLVVAVHALLAAAGALGVEQSLGAAYEVWFWAFVTLCLATLFVSLKALVRGEGRTGGGLGVGLALGAVVLYVLLMILIGRT